MIGKCFVWSGEDQGLINIVFKKKGPKDFDDVLNSSVAIVT